MLLSEAVKTILQRHVTPPDFFRTLKPGVFAVTFWDQENSKGLTLEIQQYNGKWALYVRAQDKLGHFGISSYVEMMVRAQTFIRAFQSVLQRDYWYGPNDNHHVWIGAVYYKGSQYKAAIAHTEPKEIYHELGLPRRDFLRLWSVEVDDPETIEAALKYPKKFIVKEGTKWSPPVDITPYPKR